MGHKIQRCLLTFITLILKPTPTKIVPFRKIHLAKIWSDLFFVHVAQYFHDNKILTGVFWKSWIFCWGLFFLFVCFVLLLIKFRDRSLFISWGGGADELVRGIGGSFNFETNERYRSV